MVGQAAVARIIVVDNASGDGTAEMVRSEFPAVELIANTENVGFSAGNNQAVLLIMDSGYVIVVGGAMLPGYVFVLFLQPRMK